LQHWPMLRFVFHLAAQHHWKSFTEPAIRSWARPSKVYPDAKRPERALLTALYPSQSPKKILIRAFRTQLPAAPTLRLQAAAWIVLCRVMPLTQCRAVLAGSPATAPLASDLNTAA